MMLKSALRRHVRGAETNDWLLSAIARDVWISLVPLQGLAAIFKKVIGGTKVLSWRHKEGLADLALPFYAW